MQNQLIIVTPEQLKEIFKESFLEFVKEYEASKETLKYYSINAASKKMQFSYSKTKRLINDGLIEITPDNRITNFEIKRYLNENN